MAVAVEAIENPLLLSQGVEQNPVLPQDSFIFTGRHHIDGPAFRDCFIPTTEFAQKVRDRVWLLGEAVAKMQVPVPCIATHEARRASVIASELDHEYWKRFELARQINPSLQN